MRKEYSDLTASQKIIYYKRGVVFGLCLFVPLAVFFGATMVVFSAYHPVTEKITETNSTFATLPAKETDNTFVTGFALWLIMSGAGIVGLGCVGSDFGVWVCNRLKLYTDFQLEDAERRVAEIKKALEHSN